jgi:2-octaprenyl-6-methoxyphenol hydroxylase
MEKDVTTSTDIIIVGGGLAGATLAKALASLDLKITLVEKKFLNLQLAAQPVIDQRALALNYGSLSIFKKLLNLDINHFGTCVTDIYVSDQHGFGRIALNAREENLPYFGCVVPILHLTEILQKEVLDDHRIKCVEGECTALSQDAQGVQCEVSGETLQASMLIGADGTHSKVREFLAIKSLVKEYQQTALIGNVKLQGISPHTAYERFTSEGPLALLPLDHEHMTLVWVMPSTVANLRQNLPMTMLLEDLQKIMGYRAGRFKALGYLQAYPLTQVLAEGIYKERIGLLGNAAHSLHPIAAQGFNLSMRDIFGFYQVVKRYRDALPTPELIWQEYERVRAHDQERTLQVTDRLLQGFTQKNPLVRLVRNSLMLELELCPPAKTALNEVMVGLT